MSIADSRRNDSHINPRGIYLKLNYRYNIDQSIHDDENGFINIEESFDFSDGNFKPLFDTFKYQVSGSIAG